jgi:hypothetical protein
VKADILLVGGTFYVIPALARPGPSKDGLPVTIFQKKKNYWMRGHHNWVCWRLIPFRTLPRCLEEMLDILEDVRVGINLVY